MINCLDSDIGKRFALYHGDCVEVARQMPDNSVDLALYSPPFANVYVYNDSSRDMGNCDDYEQFIDGYRFLCAELFRVLRPGRLAVVHCKDVVRYKGSHGRAGLADFPGMLIRAHEAAGFQYHAKTTLWRSPVTEMQKTKAHGLLYKQVRADSTFSRMGLPEYLIMLRKWPTDDEDPNIAPVSHTREGVTLDNWQQWASPVWMDVDHTDTLNVGAAREDGDEKHMCVARGSLVMTRHGYIPIEDVKVGDHVLTHAGNWRAVVARKSLGTKPVVQVHAQGVANLRVTADHRIWTREGRTLHPRQIAMRATPAWIEASDTLGHWVGLALPPVVDSPLTAHEWWVIGRWLGDVHEDTRGAFHISCAEDELPSLLAQLGDAGGFVASTRTCRQVRLKDRSGRLRSVLAKCGTGAAGKRVPAEAIELSAEKAEALLSGYLSADGHVTKDGQTLATSVSRALLLGMALVVQRARGLVPSVYAGRDAGTTVIEGRTVNTRQDWVLSFAPRLASAFVCDDGAWKKVRRIESHDAVEVWDLQIDVDESFVAEGCAVHNCPLSLDIIRRATTLYSNPNDVVFSPFAGVGSEGVGSLRLGRRFVGTELKESYFKRAAVNLREAESTEQIDLFGKAS